MEYNGDTRRAKRAAEKLVPRGRFSKIQRGYKGNTRRAKRAAERNLFLGVVFRKYKGNTKGIRGARSAPRKKIGGLGVAFLSF